MRLKQPGLPDEHEIEIAPAQAGRMRITIGGEQIDADVEPSPPAGYILRIGGRAVRIFAARLRNSVITAAGPAQFEFATVDGRSGHRAHGLATPEITAPMPGKVVKVLVAEGQRVETGDPLLVLEAMKMETVLNAESPAIVGKIRVAPGEMVDHGAVLIDLSAADPSASGEVAAPGR